MFNANYGYNLPQQRLMNYEQQYLQSQIPMQQAAFKMIPVTNEQEANATPVDIMNGTPTFFYNQGTNEIYMKKSLPNGTASFIKFAKRDDVIPNGNPTDNKNIYEQNFKSLNDKIDGLYSLLATVQEKSDQVSDQVINSRGGKNVK